MAQQMGFKTSIIGFKKTDVLSCIDRMSAESLLQKQKFEECEEACAAERAQKDALAENLTEKEQEIEALKNSLAQQTLATGEALEQLEMLKQALQQVEAEAHDYKARLFTREGEATALRRDNAQLTQTLSEKQGEMDQISSEAKQTVENCAMQMQAVRKAATEELETERDRLQQEQLTMQDGMQQGAQNMVHDVAALKQSLAVLDQEIARSMQDLQRSTQALSKTLAQTEQSMETLGAKMQQFPEVSAASDMAQAVTVGKCDGVAGLEKQGEEPKAAAPKQANMHSKAGQQGTVAPKGAPPHTRSTAQQVHSKCKSLQSTISERLSTKIGQMIGDM